MSFAHTILKIIYIWDFDKKFNLILTKFYLEFKIFIESKNSCVERSGREDDMENLETRNALQIIGHHFWTREPLESSHKLS